MGFEFIDSCKFLTPPPYISIVGEQNADVEIHRMG
jgi:hypothetical protein